MIIRTFIELDASKVAQLFYDTVHAINAQDYAPELINLWAPNNDEFVRLVISCQDNVFYVAEQHGNIVGFGDMTHDGHIERLFVHKDFQGCGIGSAVYKALENQAYALGLIKLTTEASVRAMPFFKARGFAITKTVYKEHQYKELVFTTYEMEKELT